MRQTKLKFGSVCVPIASSAREKVFPPKFELPSTSEPLSIVVCSISQLERHYCPGASAVEDLSSPGSGSILPSVLSSLQIRTSNDIFEQRDRGLEGWVVPIGATITCTATRPLLSMIMCSNLANSSSVKLAVPPSSSFKTCRRCHNHSAPI